MSKLLYIKASPRCAQSKSSAVADAYRTALRTRLPDLVVDALELAQEGIPDFDDGQGRAADTAAADTADEGSDGRFGACEAARGGYQ